MSRLREREVDNKIVITESEIDALLAAERQDGSADEVNLSHILIVVPENAKPEQVQARRARAEELLALVDLHDSADKMVSQLSGGQKQRVAIARALINNPLLIMGDEPTGNLDKKNSELVFDIFQELAESYQQSLLIVTHDQEFASKTQRTIVMEDGKIIADSKN
jgi:ABC-type lipoprotein export system ATPase subunit